MRSFKELQHSKSFNEVAAAKFKSNNQDDIVLTDVSNYSQIDVRGYAASSVQVPHSGQAWVDYSCDDLNTITCKIIYPQFRLSTTHFT